MWELLLYAFRVLYAFRFWQLQRLIMSRFVPLSEADLFLKQIYKGLIHPGETFSMCCRWDNVPLNQVAIFYLCFSFLFFHSFYQLLFMGPWFPISSFGFQLNFSNGTYYCILLSIFESAAKDVTSNSFSTWNVFLNWENQIEKCPVFILQIIIFKTEHHQPLAEWCKNEKLLCIFGGFFMME